MSVSDKITPANLKDCIINELDPTTNYNYTIYDFLQYYVSNILTGQSNTNYNEAEITLLNVLTSIIVKLDKVKNSTDINSYVHTYNTLLESKTNIWLDNIIIQYENYTRQNVKVPNKLELYTKYKNVYNIANNINVTITNHPRTRNNDKLTEANTSISNFIEYLKNHTAPLTEYDNVDEGTKHLFFILACEHALIRRVGKLLYIREYVELKQGGSIYKISKKRFANKKSIKKSSKKSSKKSLKRVVKKKKK